MSGIIGIVNPRGVPVDERLLRRMTEFLAYRGPDAQETWIDGSVGFGHTLLRTTDDTVAEQQPCSLDGQVWITADARVDGRADLIHELASRGQAVAADAPDVELILHAYHAWGETCVEHLIGDFAFVIWDGRREQLLCARDQFGVKPFYYADVEGALVVGNTLNAIRLHPDVSNSLNDQVIGDILLFGFNQEISTTTFADIKRLPPAHALTWADGTVRIRRFWSLPDVAEIRYPRDGDYVEQFRELLRLAVADRLRTDRAGILMSGGLDSTSLAAIACETLTKRSPRHDLRAHTMVWDRRLPCQERYYGGLAAAAIAIPLHCVPFDDHPPFERWDEPELHTPEPLENSQLTGHMAVFQELAAHSRVGLTGNGGDLVLIPVSVAEQLRTRAPGPVVRDVWSHLLTRRRLPPLGFRVRARLIGWLGKGQSMDECPGWLRTEFVDRQRLTHRLKQIADGWNGPTTAFTSIHERMRDPIWQYLFEFFDQSVPGPPIEFRHPYFDVRLISFLFAVPAIPWRVNKGILRAAMQGLLPDSVRLRPKKAMPELWQRLRDPVRRQLEAFTAAPAIGRYVDVQALKADEQADERQFWRRLYALSLNYWLKGLEAAHDIEKENRNAVHTH